MRVAMARLSGSFACAHEEGGSILFRHVRCTPIGGIAFPMNGLRENGRHWVQQHIEQATIR